MHVALAAMGPHVTDDNVFTQSFTAIQRKVNLNSTERHLRVPYFLKVNILKVMKDTPRLCTIELQSYKHAGLFKNTREVPREWQVLLVILECSWKFPSAFITQQCMRNKFLISFIKWRFEWAFIPDVCWWSFYVQNNVEYGLNHIFSYCFYHYFSH